MNEKVGPGMPHTEPRSDFPAHQNPEAPLCCSSPAHMTPLDKANSITLLTFEFRGPKV